MRNEAETRAELIDPALTAAGWGTTPDSRIRREVLAPGRILDAGRRGEPTTADYVLYANNRRIAVIEAKAEDKHPTAGLAQAKIYAEKLTLRWAYATNGHAIYRADLHTGAETPITHWTTPAALHAETYPNANPWRDRFPTIPFEDKSGSQPPRYYQVNAVEKVLDAIAAGETRILLTLATGTGKTFIAFQIAWKLFHTRWNLSREPTRRPRILFLADRNILADQAYNAFSAFPEDALIRIKPDAIRRKGRVPKNGSIFFTIFQTFTAGPPDENGKPNPYFGDYPPDFFDLIIIDECHRGGANAESEWRYIMEYFAPAVQLGLPATPLRRNENRDTYAYFGKPAYTYSLRQGIQDGFLTPFKVRQHKTTIDEYIYTLDDTVISGTPKQNHIYTSNQFNRAIEIKERETYRTKAFLSEIDQHQKTLVFCASQDHALTIRDTINQLKTSPDPHYCERVTADDGEIGEQWLRRFQDNDKTIPTILTTSQKLSTGVDARNVRDIILLRPINSMIEFKQIIGRGTRLYEGKDYFTIHDFENTYQHFLDPEWDGEPVDPQPAPTPKQPRQPAPTPPPRPEKVVIKLADGKARTIQHISATSFWGPDGRPLSAAEFMEALFGKLPDLFRNEDQLRSLWGDPEARKTLLEELEHAGFGAEPLHEMARLIDAPETDIFDVLAYVAFALPPITRAERVQHHQPAILSRYSPDLQTFITFILGQYVAHGIGELGSNNLSQLLQLKYNSATDAATRLRGIPLVRSAYLTTQHQLFARP